VAFAAYRAPVDFVRSGAPNASDQGAAQRSVIITVNSLQNGAKPNLQITLVRPPVFLVHGFNSDSSDWDAFTPLLGNQLFQIYKADYGMHLFTAIYTLDDEGEEIATYQPATAYNIQSTNPSYSLDSIHESGLLSHLGFTVTSDVVSGLILGEISTFKSGDNPLSIPVAAIAADLVAHSMGGLVVRNWTINSSVYLVWTNYNQGAVHKLITLGTPHYGTPQAILSTLSQSSCSRWLAAFGDSLFLTNAIYTNGSSTSQVSGAAGELGGDGIGAVLSPALKALAASTVKIPIAPIAGDVSSIVPQLGYAASLAAFLCGNSDPLASRYTTQAFETIFDPHLATIPLLPINLTVNTFSDGSVPLTSALMNQNINNLSECGTGHLFCGYAHSSGIAKFFSGTVNYLQDGSQVIARQVITLLNTSVTDSAFTGGH
jgi:pimeloyl-ACP methyl ester carboxylesterase